MRFVTIFDKERRASLYLLLQKGRCTCTVHGEIISKDLGDVDFRFNEPNSNDEFELEAPEICKGIQIISKIWQHAFHFE